MSSANKTGPFQLQPQDLDHRDVSSVRRMLGGVHGSIVVSAWNSKTTMSRLLVTSRNYAEVALAKAARK